MAFVKQVHYCIEQPQTSLMWVYRPLEEFNFNNDSRLSKQTQMCEMYSLFETSAWS